MSLPVTLDHWPKASVQMAEDGDVDVEIYLRHGHTLDYFITPDRKKLGCAWMEGDKSGHFNCPIDGWELPQQFTDFAEGFFQRNVPNYQKP